MIEIVKKTDALTIIIDDIFEVDISNIIARDKKDSLELGIIRYNIGIYTLVWNIRNTDSLQFHSAKELIKHYLYIDVYKFYILD